MRQKIDQMGPINVDALQEYNELKERYDLLSAQQNDINESINNLKATIAKLDGETKELFTEAFNAIQEKFKEVFSLLFEGGRAELVLLDPNRTSSNPASRSSPSRGAKSSRASRSCRAANGRSRPSPSCSRPSWSSRAPSACSTKLMPRSTRRT